MIVVAGSANIDLVARVSHHPEPGETLIAGSYAIHQGGKGANQAVAAARLGASVRFVGAVGDDEFGRASRPRSPAFWARCARAQSIPWPRHSRSPRPC